MNIETSPTFKLLALAMLPGIGPVRIRKLARLPRFSEASIEELATTMKELERVVEKPGVWAKAQETAAQQFDTAAKTQARIISLLDPDYPPLLSSSKDDPVILYVRGVLSPDVAGSVAIIGTREPTQHGEIVTARITEFFVKNKWSIVSGLAIGCDAIAHRTALELNGHTVAVLAHGLQTIAPKQHQRLADEILAKGGALVSEYKFGQGVIPQQFVKRDRTQAGLAQGVVMVQSDLTGGSLHASRAAISYDRWLAIPYPTKDDLSRNESKIQANLLLCEGSDLEKAKLLMCRENDLSHLRVLRGKEDYRHLIQNVNSTMSCRVVGDKKNIVTSQSETNQQLSFL